MVSAPTRGAASAVLQKRSSSRFGREVSVPLSMLREFLDRNRIQYLVISHSVAYTAQGIAALTHIPGKELAKTVMVMVDGRLAMAVVPASFRVDLYRLKKYLGADAVELASEARISRPFSRLRNRIHAAVWQSLRHGCFRGPDSGRRRGNRLQRGFAPGTGAHEICRFPDLVKPAMIPLAAGKAHIARCVSAAEKLSVAGRWSSRNSAS